MGKDKSLDETAKLVAIKATPFGKYRIQLKYNKFEITLGGFIEASIPKLDDKRSFSVPTLIQVIARRSGS